MNREKPNIKCPKCGYQWHTRSALQMVSCPSCNQKTRNLGHAHIFTKFIQQKRGIVGLETAIILIAFVTIAAAFSFMVVNQGLFATNEGKNVIQQGLQQASTPLMQDGTTLVRTTSQSQAALIIIPLKAFGVNSVNMAENETTIMLQVGDQAWANIYLGIMYMGNNGSGSNVATSTIYNPNGQQFENFVGFVKATNSEPMNSPCYINGTYPGVTQQVTGAVLALANSSGDQALNSGEEGYLIVALGQHSASATTPINIELKTENSATLTVAFTVPVDMPASSYVPVY